MHETFISIPELQNSHLFYGFLVNLLRQPKGHHLQPPEEKRREFKKLVSDAARSFLSRRTDRFVDELELFLASGLNLDAYDKVCMEHLHMATSLAPSDGSADDENDQDVRDSRSCFPHVGMD